MFMSDGLVRLRLALIALVEGMPHGCPVDAALINRELRRRQGGYGRGRAQKIETDHVEFLSGVRLGKTIGSPIAMLIPNKDNRLDDLAATPPLHRPRPGHADLAGAVKWLTTDCREVLERASAAGDRRTRCRRGAGPMPAATVRHRSLRLRPHTSASRGHFDRHPDNWRELAADATPRKSTAPTLRADAAMKEFITQQKMAKDTAGGIVECHVFGCPVGIGSCMTWDGRLDSRIAAAVVGIQAFKGVEIGLGFADAAAPVEGPRRNRLRSGARERPGLGFVRTTNNAGGLEGGMTNGQPVVVRGAMKPISTLGKPLESIDLRTRENPKPAGSAPTSARSPPLA